MNIYAIECNEKISQELYDNLINLIDENYKERCLNIKNWQDSQRVLFGRLLSRYAICRDFKIKNSSIYFIDNLHGKPLLKNYEDIHFNVSHSGDWVVCATSTADIGIDVQKIKPTKLSLANRFFSAKENEYIHSLEEKDKVNGFFDVWTFKEAYVKAMGTGLTLSLKDFSIIKNNGDIELIAEKNANYFFKQYDFSPDYKLSICHKINSFPEEVTFITLDEILEQLK